MMKTQNTNTQNPSDSDSSANPQFSQVPRAKSERRLTGKVAQLPHLVRMLVNVMLDNGFTYRAIASKLEEIGYPGFVHQNIQRWKNRGYQLWLRQREQRLQAAMAISMRNRHCTN